MGIRNCAIIIRREAENEPTIEWYYLAPPSQQSQVSSDTPPSCLKFMTSAPPLAPASHPPHCLSYSLLMLYFNVFGRLCLEHFLKTTRQSQPFQNSRIAHPHWIEALSHLQHYLRFLVESWWARTKLRTRTSRVSFPTRPPLVSFLSCDRTG